MRGKKISRRGGADGKRKGPGGGSLRVEGGLNNHTEVGGKIGKEL